MRFHRRELGRLQPAHGAGAVVAAQDLQGDAEAGHGQRKAQRAAMEQAVPVS